MGGTLAIIINRQSCMNSSIFILDHVKYVSRANTSDDS